MSKDEIIEILAWEHGRSQDDPAIIAFAEMLDQAQNQNCTFVQFKNVCLRAAAAGVQYHLIKAEHEIFDFFKTA